MVDDNHMRDGDNRCQGESCGSQLNQCGVTNRVRTPADSYKPTAEGDGADAGDRRRLLEHEHDGDPSDDDSAKHVQLGSEPVHVAITGHGQIALANTLMLEGEHVRLKLLDDGEVRWTDDVVQLTVQLQAQPGDGAALVRSACVWRCHFTTFSNSIPILVVWAPSVLVAASAEPRLWATCAQASDGCAPHWYGRILRHPLQRFWARHW
jgi:hypothetical protein